MLDLPPRQQQRLMAALARQDFGTFALRASPVVNGEPLLPNWHINAIAYKLAQVARGEVKRLLICLPPRCLKSYLASVCFPAWMLGKDPKSKILCASYANSLAEKFSTDTRMLMQDPWYRSVFPNTLLNPQKLARDEFATTENGFRLATSVGGTLTGRGGNIIIVDDPLKAGDTYSEAARNSSIDWFKTTVQSRLNNPKEGAIIVVAQRLHAQDLPGHLIEAGEWDQLILPMENPHEYELDVLRDGLRCRVPQGRLLQPERHGLEELARIRREMGERDYEAQYNQAPLPPGGALFKRSWLKRYDEHLPLEAYDGIFQSWDTAYEVGDNNDYSVCTTWGVRGHEFHLLHVFRERLEFPALQRAVLRLRSEWQARVVIVEKIGSGNSLYQNLREAEPDPWIKTMRPESSKEHRASQQTPRFERGEVFLPNKAEWLCSFEDELLSFPSGKFDDQVDSAVQFLAAVDTGDLIRRDSLRVRVL
jgi:predicted phage terminase large subunit-like protein